MVNDAVLQAFSRLANDSDFRTFLDEMKRRRETARDKLESALDPWMAGRLQGESKFAGEILELAATARDAIEKRNRQTQGSAR